MHHEIPPEFTPIKSPEDFGFMDAYYMACENDDCPMPDNATVGIADVMHNGTPVCDGCDQEMGLIAFKPG